ncbi:MAG TPA: exodeoxyribonuclease VII large subunit [Rhodoblastus sp.]|nr:exodeoxyribonuclease VII large subunit [Rhodoblastus sp.]
MAESPAGNAPELSVSELAAALKRTVEDRFGFVRVRGEISNYRGPHSSGHAYFCLKDQNARLDAVVWKGVFGRLRTKPEEGLEVIATGKLTTFPGKSSYQIVIEAIEPAGVGALLAQLEERRRRLAAEGLFDAARKQLIPYLPTTIGVVTSPTGAVIRDILHRIRDRFPRDVLVWPVRVQGETAAGEVAAAIRGFNALPEDGAIRRPDVLIVARGGGSLEDLWAFNEEIVVRAAAESHIPLVSAIGHETDTTLIDHAADLRAPTPTGAAEKVVPVRIDLLAQQTELARRLAHAQTRLLDLRRNELRALARVLPTPDDILGGRRQSLDACASGLRKDMRDLLARRQRRLADLAAVLARHSPHAELERTRRRFEKSADALTRLGATITPARADALMQIGGRLDRAMENRMVRGRDQIARRRETLATWHGRLAPAFARLMAQRRERLATLEKLRASLGYENVLARGFALVRDERDAPLRSAAAVAPGQKLVLQFADGRAHATADGDAPPRKPGKPARTQGGQGSLF